MSEYYLLTIFEFHNILVNFFNKNKFNIFSIQNGDKCNTQALECNN